MVQNNSSQTFWLEEFRGVAHGRHFVFLGDLPKFLQKCNEAGLRVVGFKLSGPVQCLECILEANDKYVHHFGKKSLETWYFRP